MKIFTTINLLEINNIFYIKSQIIKDGKETILKIEETETEFIKKINESKLKSYKHLNNKFEKNDKDLFYEMINSLKTSIYKIIKFLNKHKNINKNMFVNIEISTNDTEFLNGECTINIDEKEYKMNIVANKNSFMETHNFSSSTIFEEIAKDLKINIDSIDFEYLLYNMIIALNNNMYDTLLYLEYKYNESNLENININQ